MKPLSYLSLVLTVVVVLVPTVPAGAQAPDLAKSVTLSAHGGVTLNVPSWQPGRSEDTVAIFERVGGETRGGFTTLVLAVEEASKDPKSVKWDAVRDNILGAAKGAGSNLTLSLVGDWGGASGFSGQRLRGAMRSGDRDVAVEMVILVASGLMVTVTALGASGDARLVPLTDAVAKTARRKAP